MRLVFVGFDLTLGCVQPIFNNGSYYPSGGTRTGTVGLIKRKPLVLDDKDQRETISSKLWSLLWDTTPVHGQVGNRHQNLVLLVNLEYHSTGRNECQTGFIRVQDGCPKGFFERLHNALDSFSNFDVQLRITLNVDYGSNNVYMTNAFTFDVSRMHKKSKIVSYNRSTFEVSSKFKFNRALIPHWEMGTQSIVTGKLDVIVHLKEKTLDLIYLKCLSLEPCTNRSLLDDASKTGDVFLCANRNVKIPCHWEKLKSVAKIPNMETDEFGKPTAKSIDMTEFSEKSVCALLEYIYLNDIHTCIESGAGVAVEVLVAADKFEIYSLYNAMRDFILQKSYTWFSIASAVQLLVHAINKHDDFENTLLKYKWAIDKALLVLKLKPKIELQNKSAIDRALSDSELAKKLFLYSLYSSV